MPHLWIDVALSTVFFLALGLVLVLLQRRDAVRRPPAAEPVEPPMDERERRLARRLAGTVGCTLVEALPAVRREIGYAPGQSDDTLLKWAAYHYRQDLPEPPCPIYRDQATG